MSHPITWALIKAIADFIKEELCDTTLAQEVATPKRKSGELDTQTVRHLTTPPQSVALPSTSSAGEVVYETETSPISTRFSGATAAAYDDVGDDDDNMDTVPLEKRYTHLLESLSVKLLTPTCHHMYTRVAFSM